MHTLMIWPATYLQLYEQWDGVVQTRGEITDKVHTIPYFQGIHLVCYFPYSTLVCELFALLSLLSHFKLFIYY